MSDIKLAYIIQRPPYKSETSTLGYTHAISYQVVEMLLEDGQNVIPTVCMVGEGVLNLLKDQKAMENYGVTSIESHGKNSLLVDLDMLVCKEDLERFGIAEDRLLDAEDMGADKKLQIVPYAEIQKVMEDSHHLLFF
jgi:sulfur relay (sulfurtransferase) DsrF/TusC family protein